MKFLKIFQAIQSTQPTCETQLQVRGNKGRLILAVPVPEMERLEVRELPEPLAQPPRGRVWIPWSLHKIIADHYRKYFECRLGQPRANSVPYWIKSRRIQ